MGNIVIRLTIFSAAKDGLALYSQQKQDLELNSKFKLKLKRVGKNTGLVGYNL